MSNEHASFENPWAIIMDSANQLMQFKYFPDFEKIKELLKQHELKTMEEYTGRTTAQLEAVKPGVTRAYNALVERLRNPELTKEEFDEIMKEAYKITH